MTHTHHSKQLRARNFGLLGLLIASFLSIGSISGTQQPAPQASTIETKRLMAVDGATLDQISLAQGNMVYLQTIDLRKMQIDQLVGEVAGKGSKGLYYPSNNDRSSPSFKRLTVPEVRSVYQKQHPAGVFSIVNASFFEEYESSTRLSFPIKVNGSLITGGSSPYGPIAHSKNPDGSIEKPKHPYYQKVQLKVLTWDREKATISNYNAVTGYPLNQPSIKNGLVSYAYQDHPAYVLNRDPVNLYHVVGVVNGAGKANRLLIATTNRTTLKGAAEILRQQGVKGDIMTIDGGVSTYLWSDKSGDLILPKVVKDEKVAALPHYLGIRPKNER